MQTREFVTMAIGAGVASAAAYSFFGPEGSRWVPAAVAAYASAHTGVAVARRRISSVPVSDGAQGTLDRLVRFAHSHKLPASYAGVLADEAPVRPFLISRNEQGAHTLHFRIGNMADGYRVLVETAGTEIRIDSPRRVSVTVVNDLPENRYFIHAHGLEKETGLYMGAYSERQPVTERMPNPEMTTGHFLLQRL